MRHFLTIATVPIRRTLRHPHHLHHSFHHIHTNNKYQQHIKPHTSLPHNPLHNSTKYQPQDLVAGLFEHLSTSTWRHPTVTPSNYATHQPPEFFSRTSRDSRIQPPAKTMDTILPVSPQLALTSPECQKQTQPGITSTYATRSTPAQGNNSSYTKCPSANLRAHRPHPRHRKLPIW
jgi:hypothetical protein